jgi:DNA repair protein RadC
MKYVSIKNWANDDRPREKLLSKGIQSLSDAELLGILMGTGTREISAVELGRQVLAQSQNNLSLLGKKTISELTRIKGIGKVKALSIITAMELGRRRNMAEMPERFQVCSSREAYNYVHPLLTDLVHEEFWVLYLNRSNKIIEPYKCSQGGVSGTVIDVKLILKKALEVLASSIIISHNHPSGNALPSDNDKQITEKLGNASRHMDIKLLDHIIVANDAYFSFADEGLI